MILIQDFDKHWANLKIIDNQWLDDATYAELNDSDSLVSPLLFLIATSRLCLEEYHQIHHCLKLNSGPPRETIPVFFFVPISCNKFITSLQVKLDKWNFLSCD